MNLIEPSYSVDNYFIFVISVGFAFSRWTWRPSSVLIAVNYLFIKLVSFQDLFDIINMIKEAHIEV